MRLLLALLLTAAAGPLPAHPLLRQAIEKWSAERTRWSFTQRVHETGDDGMLHERVEHYDFSRGPEKRWRLVSVNGRDPTPEEREKWEHRKNRRPPRPPRPLDDYLDFDRAEIVDETGPRIEFRVPLRRPKGWLASGSNVNLLIAVDHESESVVRAQALLDGPMNMALGLFRVIHLDLDLEASPEDNAPPHRIEPEGTAYAVVNKLGRRIEYEWSDFVYPVPE